MIYQTIRGFLGTDVNSQLLEYVVASESKFQPSKVGTDTVRLDFSVRISNVLDDLDRFHAVVEQRVLALVPDLIDQLGLSPFTPVGVETQIAAHGEGAFFGRHIDLFTRNGGNKETDRLISLVYYFYKEPRAFSGGLLRLFPLPGVAGRPGEEAIDVVPEQDAAVAFSSWMPHEVLPVSCPSGRFSESRFAINCWVLRARIPANQE